MATNGYFKCKKMGKRERQTEATGDDCEGDESHAHVSNSPPERRPIGLIRWYSPGAKHICIAQNIKDCMSHTPSNNSQGEPALIKS